MDSCCAIMNDFLCAVPLLTVPIRKETCHIFIKTYFYGFLCILKEKKYVATCCVSLAGLL